MGVHTVLEEISDSMASRYTPIYIHIGQCTRRATDKKTISQVKEMLQRGNCILQDIGSS